MGSAIVILVSSKFIRRKPRMKASAPPAAPFRLAKRERSTANSTEPFIFIELLILISKFPGVKAFSSFQIIALLLRI